MTTDIVKPLSTQDLLATYAREYVLLAGKDSVGKTSALVSLASFVSMMWPDARCHIIDSEHKFGSAIRSFGTDAPTNIAYYPVDNMNQATMSLRTILGQHRPGDWLFVESMARMWEHSQNLGYEAIAGVSKIEYLDWKLNTALPTGVVRKNSPIPNPDDFWAIVKGAHDGGFVNLITNTTDLNVVMTTTLKAPPKDRGNREESKDRKILRAELGIDLNMDGAPRLPYYVETMCLLELAGGKVSCRVLRDNNSKRDNTRPEFSVPDRKSWAMTFYSECR